MKVLIIGLGSIARKHIAALKKIDAGVEIYALRSDRNAVQVDSVINLYDIKECRQNFDFAIISNPTSLHANAIRSILGLNIPMFIEKPVFESLGYEELLKDISEKGIKTYVACNLRFLESLRYLHDYIRNNPQRRINEVNVYCGSYLPEWRPGTDYRKCYSAIPELGGGVHIDLIHDIDYVYWIFGKPESYQGICRNVSSLDIRAIDYANYQLIYPGFTASIILNYYRRDYKRTLEVVFEDDTWTVDLKENAICNSKGVVIFKGKNAPLDTYKSQLEYFIDLVVNGGNPENNINVAYDILKICLGYERFE